MPANYLIGIVMQAYDKASKNIKEVGNAADAAADGLEEMEEASESSSQGLDGMLKGALNVKNALTGMAVVGAAKAVWELGELGAQSLRTARAFEAISGGAEEAQENLEAMRKATRGAMSEQEMMAHSSRLMQMGLANNSHELGEMVTMATRLGTAMGRDASQSVEEFALLLANQSIPRLDTFGISAGKVRARILELQEATEGLSREEAFLQAVREQGAVAMERLGESTEDEALAFEQLKASTADLTAAYAERLAPAISKVAGLLADQATAVIEHTTTADVYEQQLWALGHAADEVAEKSQQMGANSYYYARAQENATKATEAAIVPTQDLVLSTKDLASAFGELEIDDEQMLKMAVAAGADIEQIGELAEILGIASSRETDLITASYQLAQDLADHKITTEEYAEKMNDLGKEIDDARFVAEQSAKAQEALKEWQQRAAISADEAAEKHDELAAAMWRAEQAAWALANAGAAPGRGAGGVAEHQYGTAYHRGGMAIVGEAGAEAVTLPRGARVHTAQSSTTQRILNDQRNYNVNINNQLAMAMFMEQQRRDRLRQADALM